MTPYNHIPRKVIVHVVESDWIKKILYTRVHIDCATVGSSLHDIIETEVYQNDDPEVTHVDNKDNDRFYDVVAEMNDLAVWHYKPGYNVAVAPRIDRALNKCYFHIELTEGHEEYENRIAKEAEARTYLTENAVNPLGDTANSPCYHTFTEEFKTEDAWKMEGLTLVKGCVSFCKDNDGNALFHHAQTTSLPWYAEEDDKI